MEAPMCQDCVTGTLRGDLTPAGVEEVVHNVPTYVTHPDPGIKPLGTVVILPDAFGWTLRNTRVLADAYAKRVPCTVYVPEFMNGHAVPESFLSLSETKPSPNANILTRTFQKTLTTLSILPQMVTFLYHNRQAVAQPRIQSFLASLRAASPTTPIGVAGFCWGGLHAILLTHDTPQNSTQLPDGTTRPLIDCAFTAHPSMLSLPGHVHDVVRPLSVANGGEDEYLPREKMGVLVEILEEKEKASGEEGRYQAVVYPGAKHGFAVRGDWADEKQRERAEKCEDQAVEWFKRWFAEGVTGEESGQRR